jgi:hypothetical protein
LSRAAKYTAWNRYIGETAKLARLAELRCDFSRDKIKVVQVGEVQQLQVDPLDTRFGITAEGLDNLGRRAGYRGCQELIDVVPDRGGPPGDLGVISSAAQDECD